METHCTSHATPPLCEKTSLPDLLLLSHVRWRVVARSEAHLHRWARERRVFFIEEPRFRSFGRGVPSRDGNAQLLLQPQGERLIVVTPRLPTGLTQSECVTLQRQLIDKLLRTYAVDDYLLWYHTPMALGYTRHLSPRGVIYDCMDELVCSDCAPRQLRCHELELFAHADVVLSHGAALDRKSLSLPPELDARGMLRARNWESEPFDQAIIGRPRIGCFGVIDERMDLELIDGLAQARPQWQLVLIGPLGKIDIGRLPQRPNIHYLGLKTYEELPAYLSGWDVAIMPFAHNEATRNMSPVKTAEYLDAGRPVVSTGIPDVIKPFGEKGLVRIADTLPDFLSAVDASLDEELPPPHYRIEVPAWTSGFRYNRPDRPSERQLEISRS